MQVGCIDSDGTREGTLEVEGIWDTEGFALGETEGASEGAPDKEGAELGTSEADGLDEAVGADPGVVVGSMTVGFMVAMAAGILVPFSFPP